ncbi:MAG: hypothetical protein HQL71_04695 [Magnetococcales bacterium]|nr:hypothetical protein [Magnetococcales bacterium]
MILFKASSLAVYVGISYLMFRISLLTYELQTEQISMPSLINYFGFAFFLPTFTIGPISPYSDYAASIATPLRFNPKLILVALDRIIVGLVKLFFISKIAHSFIAYGLLNLDWLQSWGSILIVAIASYIYIYSNFSGFCDVMIGFSALLDIKIQENFDHTVIARNLQDFWSKMHMTLSTYIRYIIYQPLCFHLMRNFGPGAVVNGAPFVMAATLVGIALWHGVTLNFLLFGLMHAVGMIVLHYYGFFINKIVSKPWKRILTGNPYATTVSTIVTFIYVSFSCLLFFFDVNIFIL